MKAQRPFRIFAHRGFSGKYPENTLSAFRKALECGSEAIELDVIRSQDGQFAVSHDAVIECSDGRERDIRHTRAAELADWPLPERFRGEGIPLLQDVLSLVPAGVMINIELKVDRSEDACRVCSDFSEFCRSNAERRSDFLISSFHLHLLRCVQKSFQKNSWKIPTAFLLDRDHCWANRYFLLRGWSADYLHIGHDMNIRFWSRLKRFGAVHVYTVNDIGAAEHLRQMGAGGIFSDYPDRMLKHFKGS